MEHLELTRPADGEPLASVRAASPADAAAAALRARRAQPLWEAQGFAARAEALRRLTRRIVRDARLLDVLVAESGKPRFEAEAIELLYLSELTRFATGRTARRALADHLRYPHLALTKRMRVTRRPRGVVGVIGPYNWPLLNHYADAVMPLVCGNSVVLKPAERTPLTSLRVAELWREEGLPAGVLEVLPGGAAAGQAVVAAVDMIFFTGSARAGREVAQEAARRLIPAVLELGGKSAMIVLADADLEAAARAAVWSAFAHSGQVCMRSERAIVEAAVAERFIELCLAAMGGLRHGPAGASDASDALFDVGAMTVDAQIATAERQITEARSQGAVVRAGGRRAPGRRGSWFEPTLLSGVTEDMAVAREETFAPVLPVLVAADAEAALAMANRSAAGLSGSVWTRDAKRGLALARRLESGSVCVNDVLLNYMCVESPLGGLKASGLGVRHGVEALHQFTVPRTILEDRPILGLASPFIEPYLRFPYREPVLRVLRWLARRS